MKLVLILTINFDWPNQPSSGTMIIFCVYTSRTTDARWRNTGHGLTYYSVEVTANVPGLVLPKKVFFGQKKGHY